MDADQLIHALCLEPHPEGGRFREVFRDPAQGRTRGSLTSIYYLLRQGERSHWHRVKDAVEIWYFHAGAPLILSLSGDGVRMSRHRLGLDVALGERPQAMVPAGCWQAAESLGPWTLVGCAVAPAFSFAGFEMAPPDWRPGQ